MNAVETNNQLFINLYKSKPKIFSYWWSHGFQKTSYIDDIKKHTNFIHAGYDEWDALDKARQDGGYLILCNFTDCFSKNYNPDYILYEDWEDRLIYYTWVMGDYRNELLGIMPFDEPYHRGLTYSEINEVYRAIKFYFPDKLVFCNFSSINNAVKYGVPEYADVLSVTPNYSKFDLTYYLGLLDGLRNIKSPHQALMIVSNGYNVKNAGDGGDKDRVKLAYDLLQIVSEEDVLGIIVFLYPSPGSKEQGVVDLPQTKKAYERIGGILTGKNFVY